jgi:hypothetical protein
MIIMPNRPATMKPDLTAIQMKPGHKVRFYEDLPYAFLCCK